MAPVDGINPFITSSITPQIGGGSTPRVNPFVETPQVEKVGGGQQLAGFKAEKWTQGLSGLRTGALGDEAVYSKLPGGKETRLGGRLNVDAFSAVPA